MGDLKNEPVTYLNGRIAFGTGDNRWTSVDPRRWDNRLSEEIQAMTEAKLFTAREMVSEHLALLYDGTTERACEKLRAMRRALKGAPR